MLMNSAEYRLMIRYDVIRDIWYDEFFFLTFAIVDPLLVII